MEFTNLMTIRRALAEDIQFYEPGSPEYIKIDNKIKEIDNHKFNSDVNQPKVSQ